MEPTIRVLLAEDDPLAQEAVAAYLARTPDLELVGVAGDGLGAVELARSVRPDVAVVDISAMVYDRLAADRPLMVTRPVDPAAIVDTHGYLSDAEWLDADDAPRILEETARVLSDPDAVSRLEGWVRHYFGDTAPGAASARFAAAIGELMARWETWHLASSDEDDDADEAEPALVA